LEAAADAFWHSTLLQHLALHTAFQHAACNAQQGLAYNPTGTVSANVKVVHNRADGGFG
jgi:hypothetical protein